MLSAVIGKDGTVQKLKAVTGPRELIDAAIAAVQQWKYKPYMLKGEPVEVDTTITVKFSLQESRPSRTALVHHLAKSIWASSS